jgi:hypothetical protein
MDFLQLVNLSLPKGGRLPPDIVREIVRYEPVDKINIDCTVYGDDMCLLFGIGILSIPDYGDIAYMPVLNFSKDRLEFAFPDKENLTPLTIYPYDSIIIEWFEEMKKYAIINSDDMGIISITAKNDLKTTNNKINELFDKVITATYDDMTEMRNKMETINVSQLSRIPSENIELLQTLI